MSEYFAMGGYAPYIWPAYAVAVVVLVGLAIVSLRTLRQRETVLRALESTRPSRLARRGGEAG